METYSNPVFYHFCKQLESVSLENKELKFVIVIVITFYPPSCLGQETATGLFGLRLQAGVPIFVEHWGGIICNFTPIFPYFQHWGVNLDHDFFQVSKLSKDQRKGLPKNGTLFFRNFKWKSALTGA